MSKRLFITAIFALILINSSTGVLAVGENTASPAATTKARLEKLQEKSQTEISRRLTGLQNALNRVNSLAKLTPAQKSSLVSQIQANIDSLTSLKSKILAETDLPTLKTDAQSITNSYRVFGLFMPKIHLLAAAETLDNIAGQMTAFAAKLETKIQEAKDKGDNVSEPETLLEDMTAKIESAKKGAQSAITTLTPLTPEGYPANKNTLQSARTILNKARQDLKDAREDARKIILALRQTSVKETSPSASYKIQPPAD